MNTNSLLVSKCQFVTTNSAVDIAVHFKEMLSKKDQHPLRVANQIGRFLL